MTTKIVVRMLMLSIQNDGCCQEKGTKKPVFVAPIVPKPELKPQMEIPTDIVGRQVKHKAFGLGKITAIEGTTIVVQFDKVGLKKMGYEFCMEKKLLEFI